MTRRIFRYPLPIDDRVMLRLPEGATVLSVAPSRTTPREIDLWALVDPDPEGGLEYRLFRVFGTGHPVTGDLGPFIGTVVQTDTSLVFHVFEVAP